MKNWAIILGLIGAASMLTSLLYFQPSLFDVAAREPYAAVAIEGLKDAYQIGEPIDFVVRVEGYGCNSGFPSVSIEKVSTGETVWSRFGEIRHFPAGYSCPLENIYQVRHIGDVERYNNDEQDRLRTTGSVPIIINSPGKYAIHVKDGIAPDNQKAKEFAVVG